MMKNEIHFWFETTKLLLLFDNSYRSIVNFVIKFITFKEKYFDILVFEVSMI